jgi:hypothetical protein
MSDESRDNIRRAHLKSHSVWPCSRDLVRTEIFVTECVHLGDLVAFQSSGESWSATYAVELKHSTENLAHDFGRQLDPKGACHSVASQVVVLQLAMDVDGLWIGEHMGLLYTPINIEEHTDGSGNLHLGWHKQGQQIHVAP